MAHPIPTTEPASLRAGDTATWTKSLSDYPASAGWVLSYELVKTSTRITFNASASGDDHLVLVAADTTAAWTAGDYQYIARATLAGAVYTAGEGAITIAPNFNAAIDARSHARTVLASLEAWIEGRDIAVGEYEIAGRRLKTIPIPDLLVLRDRYRREAANEDAATRLAAGLPSRNKINVRFGGLR